MNFWNKTVSWALLFFILGVGAFFIYDNLDRGKDYEFSNDLDKIGEQLDSKEELLEYYDALEEAYKEDEYGGDTPEETLELFVKALEEGNLELASKYFVVEKQSKFLEDIRIGQKNGVVELFIKDLSKERKKINLSNNKVRFRTYDENGVAEFSFDLILNTYTDKWKILEL